MGRGHAENVRGSPRDLLITAHECHEHGQRTKLWGGTPSRLDGVAWGGFVFRGNELQRRERRHQGV